eukprot:28074-Prorocentrum_lima.AAC.1
MADLVIPSGNLQGRLDNPLFKGSSADCWTQLLESGGTKVRDWQLLPGLQGSNIFSRSCAK